MKIGLISDTHTKTGRAREALVHLLDEGAEFIIHAGDIGDPEVLNLLQQTQRRYVAVYGNNDAHLHTYHNRFNLVQEPHYFKLAKTSFKLMHLPFYMNADTEVVLFGHTHTFECDFKNGTLFLNPGEACARNKPMQEFAMLEVTPDEFKITYYTRPTEPKNAPIGAQHFSFERVKSA